MIPDFRNCSTSPLPGCTTTTTVSATSRDLGLGLPDPDRLDHDHVEGRRQRLRRGARAPRDPAQPLAGGGRADEHAAVGRVELDARAIAQQRAARAARARDRQPASRPCAPRSRQARSSAESNVDFPAPGGPVIPTIVPRRLAAEPRRGDLAAAAPPPARGHLGRALQQVERRRRRTQIALAQPPAEIRAVARHAARRRSSLYADAATALALVRRSSTMSL